MPAGPLEELRHGYELWNSGDIEMVIAETPQDVEYHLRNDLPDLPDVEVFRGVGAGSGIPVNIHYSHLWTLRDGTPFRCDGFPGWKQGLEAAGLENVPE